MDVTLSIDEQGVWERRRQRLEALTGANSSQQQRDPAQLDQIMDPLLYSAAKGGDVDEFMIALEDQCAKKGVSLPVVLGQCSPSGNTLLHAAAENDDILRAVMDFVPEGLISRTNYRGETPLHIAARAGKTGAVELLLPHANPRDPDSSGNSALHEAVRNSHYEVIRLLLSGDLYPLYHQNNERKSPWCLAVETGDLEVLKLLLEVPSPVEIGGLDLDKRKSHVRIMMNGFGMPPTHVAVMYRKMDMLREMWKKKPGLFQLNYVGNRSPLHVAVSTNYLEGVKFLTEKFPLSTLEQDREGYLPIHIACMIPQSDGMMDHVGIVEELLRLWPDLAEFPTRRGENILHLSVRYGCISTVKYILKSSKFSHLINARDVNENTPLHLAALHWQPSVLLLLARDGRVDLKMVNNRNMTALDVVEDRMKETDAPLQKRLTRIILTSAGTPKSRELALCNPTDQSLRKPVQPPDLERLKKDVDTRMLIATFVATMTFTSGFSIPGGYNSSDPNAGIAVLLHKAMYNVFVICNSIAMYSSTIALVLFLWTQINDPHAVQNALSKSRLPLLIALAAMPLAFMAGVYVSVTKLAWLAIVVLVLGSVVLALFTMLSFYLFLCIPLGVKHPLLRRFTDLIIGLGISMSGSVSAESDGASRDADRSIYTRSRI